MSLRVRVLVALSALAVMPACAGCSFGLGPGSGAVGLRVSENFGGRTLKSVDLGTLKGGESDLQLLERHARVGTGGAASGGGASGVAASGVASIDGHGGASVDDRWFLFVNGIQATKDAAATKLYKGDHLWFDLHDASRTDSIPAVVGAFPEPFKDGIGGRRYPTTLACSLKGGCAQITDEFAHMHIPLGSADQGYGANDVLSINVGTWGQLYGEVAAEFLKYGPGTSGVYAHFAQGGHQLDLENEDGQVVKRLGPDSGLIAAVANSQDPAPTWLVTGTDVAGVRAAVRAFTAQALTGHFALAVHGSSRYPVPLSGTS